MSEVKKLGRTKKREGLEWWKVGLILVLAGTSAFGAMFGLTKLLNFTPPAVPGAVYLTFDDGPSEHTARLLDILKKYKVQATFFVTGRLGEGEWVVLQHDTMGFSVDAVEQILQFGKKNGYQFKRLEADSFGAWHGVRN